VLQARDSEGRQPGQVHYENLCMKAVNQSIGEMPLLSDYNPAIENVLN